MNEALNGIPLDFTVHSGAGAAYSGRVQSALQQIVTDFGSNLTPQKAHEELTSLINRIRTAITNNPTTHIDNIIF